MSIIGCFSSTENKKEVSNDNALFHPISNIYFNDLLDKSAEAKKPLLLYFTSFACVNSRKIEEFISNDKKLINSFHNDYIVVPLHVDSREVLPEKEQFYSKIMERKVKTVGSKYWHWEMEKFDKNALPYFVIVDEKGKKIKELIYTKDLSKLYDFFLETE